MRLIKMFGLAAVAAVAAMAFVGATAAQAEDPPSTHEIGLCAALELLCSAANVKAVQSETVATASNPNLTGGFVPEECSSSTSKGKETSPGAMGRPALLGTITALTWTGCSPCTTVETNGLPYSSKITVNSEHKYFLESKGEATVKGGFFCFGNVCKFGAANVSLEIQEKVEGGKMIVEIVAENEPLERLAGNESFCGNTGGWNARYVVSAPENSFVRLVAKLP